MTSGQANNTTWDSLGQTSGSKLFLVPSAYGLPSSRDKGVGEVSLAPSPQVGSRPSVAPLSPNCYAVDLGSRFLGD